MAGNKESFQKAMNQGHSAAWDQEWDKAAKHYKKALQEYPDNPMALTNLGLALFEQKKYEKALKHYQKAAALAPDDPLSPEKIARIYERLGNEIDAIAASLKAAELYLKGRDVDKAIDNYLHAINLQPDNLEARGRLAVVYERMGHKMEAVAEYLAAASIMQRSGSLNKAIQTVDYCLKLFPDDADIQQAKHLLNTHQLLPEPQRPSGVTASVRMAEVRKRDTGQLLNLQEGKTPPDEAHQKALVQLASLLFEGPEEVASSTKRSSKDIPGIMLHLGQAIDGQTKGQDSQAVTALEQAINAGLNHPAAFFNLGVLLIEKDPKKAQRHLQQAARDDDFALASWLLLAKILRESGNLEQSATAYLHALRMADTETLPTALARQLHRLYEPIIENQVQQGTPEAFEHICDIVASQLLRPDWREYLQIARNQLPPNTNGSAPTPLAEILLDTSNTSAIETIGFIQQLASQDKLGSALEEAYYALQDAPTYMPLHIQIAELLAQNGLVRDAIVKIKLIARLYALRGDYSQAVGLLTRGTEIAPMDVSVRSNLIELLVSHGQIEEAIQESITLADNYETLADFDKMRKVLTDTLRFIQEYNADLSWSIKILNQIADLDMQRLDWRQALRVFEQIRTLEPTDTAARTRLVELHFRLGQAPAGMREMDSFTSSLENTGDSDRAIEFLENLITDWGEKVEIRKRLVEICARNNQLDKALEQLDKVAQIYMDAGDKQNTVATLQRIISLNPPNMEEYQTALLSLKGTTRNL